MDPLAESYFSLSPFSYVANSPVNAIDPNGEKIVLVNKNLRALKNLAKIVATPDGKKVIDRLISSSNVYRIKTIFWTINSAYDWIGEIGPSRTVYAVGTRWMPSLEGGAISGAYALYHELQHAYTHELGKVNMGDNKTLESIAVEATNRMMAIYGENRMRKKYSAYRLSFPGDPSSYNREGISVSNFEYIEQIGMERVTAVGYSFDYSEKDSKKTWFGVIWANEKKEVNYKLFNSREAYEIFLEIVRNYENKKN